eukprot:1465966-Prymnesium_polylepis.2
MNIGRDQMTHRHNLVTGISTDGLNRGATPPAQIDKEPWPLASCELDVTPGSLNLAPRPR